MRIKINMYILIEKKYIRLHFAQKHDPVPCVIIMLNTINKFTTEANHYNKSFTQYIRYNEPLAGGHAAPLRHQAKTQHHYPSPYFPFD